MRPSLERLHPTFEEGADDIHTVHLFIRNHLKILHPTIEFLYLRHLTIQDVVLPGPHRLDVLGGVERSKAKLLPVHCGVADVKPSPPPVLDGLRHRKRKEEKVGFKENDAAADGINAIRARLPLHGIELPEEAKVWLDTEPALAEGDEAGNVKNIIRQKMMELDAVEEKQSTEKIVDRKRKAPKDKSDKHDPKPSGWMGSYLVTGNLDGLLVLRD